MSGILVSAERSVSAEPVSCIGWRRGIARCSRRGRAPEPATRKICRSALASPRRTAIIFPRRTPTTGRRPAAFPHFPTVPRCMEVAGMARTQPHSRRPSPSPARPRRPRVDEARRHARRPARRSSAAPTRSPTPPARPSPRAGPTSSEQRLRLGLERSSPTRSARQSQGLPGLLLPRPISGRSTAKTRRGGPVVPHGPRGHAASRYVGAGRRSVPSSSSIDALSGALAKHRRGRLAAGDRSRRPARATRTKKLLVAMTHAKAGRPDSAIGGVPRGDDARTATTRRSLSSSACTSKASSRTRPRGQVLTRAYQLDSRRTEDVAAGATVGWGSCPVRRCLSKQRPDPPVGAAGPVAGDQVRRAVEPSQAGERRVPRPDGRGVSACARLVVAE